MVYWSVSKFCGCIVSSIAIVRTSRGTTNTLCRLPLQRTKRAHYYHCNGNLHKESISGVCMNFWVRVYSCSLGFIPVVYVILGSCVPVHVVFSGVCL